MSLFKNFFFEQNISSGCFWKFQVSSLQHYLKRDQGKDVYLWILQIFQEHLLSEHLQMTASCVYLWILTSFSDHLFYRAPLGNCLFHLQVAIFRPPHTVNKYFTYAFQVFYTSRKSSYSKAFMYLKSMKLICEEVNL